MKNKLEIHQRDHLKATLVQLRRYKMPPSLYCKLKQTKWAHTAVAPESTFFGINFRKASLRKKEILDKILDQEKVVMKRDVFSIPFKVRALFPQMPTPRVSAQDLLCNQKCFQRHPHFVPRKARSIPSYIQ